MSITRRGLLGALIGLPFAAKAALGAPVPKQPKPSSKPLPAFSQKHISGIGNALLEYVEHALLCKGIRHASEFVAKDRGFGNFFLIPWEDDKLSYHDVVQMYGVPAAECVSRDLIKYYGSKARWVGVQLYYSPEGLAVSVLVTQSEKPPIEGNAVYSEWVRLVR